MAGLREGARPRIYSHVADHGHVVFRRHPFCRFFEYTRNIYHAQMFLIRPAYLYFERIFGEGLLDTETANVFYVHELLGLQNDAI